MEHVAGVLSVLLNHTPPEKGNTMSDTKATVKQVKEFFEADGGRKITLPELSALKAAGGYDAVAEGIGDGSFTY